MGTGSFCCWKWKNRWETNREPGGQQTHRVTAADLWQRREALWEMWEAVLIHMAQHFLCGSLRVWTFQGGGRQRAIGHSVNVSGSEPSEHRQPGAISLPLTLVFIHLFSASSLSESCLFYFCLPFLIYCPLTLHPPMLYCCLLPLPCYCLQGNCTSCNYLSMSFFFVDFDPYFFLHLCWTKVQCSLWLNNYHKNVALILHSLKQDLKFFCIIIYFFLLFPSHFYCQRRSTVTTLTLVLNEKEKAAQKLPNQWRKIFLKHKKRCGGFKIYWAKGGVIKGLLLLSVAKLGSCCLKAFSSALLSHFSPEKLREH